MSRKSNIRLFSITLLLCSLISGCINPFLPGRITGTETGNDDANKPQYFQTDYDKLIFPEKRRTRELGLQQSSPQALLSKAAGDLKTSVAAAATSVLDDFDCDGFKNFEDAYPLDANYPGINFDSINLPLISGNTANPAKLIFRNSISTGQHTLGTFAIKFNDYLPIDTSSGLPNYLRSISGASFLIQNYNYNYDTFGSNDYELSQYTSLNDSDLKIHLISLGNDADRSYLANAGSSLSEKLVAYSSNLVEQACAFMHSQDYNLTASNIYQLVTGRPPADPQDPLLAFRSLFSFGGAERYLNLTPTMLSIFGNDIARRWGLPGQYTSYLVDNLNSGGVGTDDIWNYLSYETLVFSTLKASSCSNDINWQGLDNTIYYLPGQLPSENDSAHAAYLDGNVSIDSRYRIKVNNPNILDLTNMTAIKMLISKEPGETKSQVRYAVKIFASGKALKAFSDRVADKLEYNFPLLDLAESGFTVDPGRNDEIVYDPANDRGDFLTNLVRNRKYECYTLFFFLIPCKNDSSLWTFLGSTVHFWPIRERCTLVAKLDRNNNVIVPPIVLPYEYLVAPDNFIMDDYLIQSDNATVAELRKLKPLYKFMDGTSRSNLGNLFEINANKGEKLLFVQGLNTGNTGLCPSLETNSKIYIENMDTKKTESIPLNSNIKQIYNYNIPTVTSGLSNGTISTNKNLMGTGTTVSAASATTPTYNAVVQNFMSELKTNAYAISFDAVGQNKCVAQNVAFQMTAGNYITPQYFLKFSLIGVTPPPAPDTLKAEALSATHIRLTWTNTTVDDLHKLNGFIIYRSKNGGTFTILNTIYPGDITSYNDENGIEENTSYAYRICAFNLQNNNSAFAEATVKTPQTKPNAPSNLQVIQQNNLGLYISWADNSLNEDEFLIEKTEGGISGTVEYNLPDNQTEYKDTKVSVGKTYTYRVKAHNSAGDSAYTEAVSIQFKALIPNDLNSLSMSLLQEDGTGITEHWLPNTEQLCMPFRIQIKGLDNVPNPLNLSEGTNIKLLPPIDPYWDTADAEPNANINKNKGTTDYGLYATNKEGTEVNVLLATFEINPTANARAESFRNVVYKAPYFDETGKVNEKDGYAFKVNSSGDLYFKTNLLTYEYFALKIESNTGTIRPGDDMLLRFALADYPDIITNPGDDSINFMSVYDKKMLWRANLYLNERTDVNDRAHDWNDLNPWNAPLAENDWNKTSYSSNVQADGRQVIIPHAFTYVRDNNYYGTVAYDYNGQDSPFEYNVKMYQQQKILGSYYEADGTFKGWQNLLIAENIRGVWGYPSEPLANPWLNFTAPKRDHSFYMHPQSYPYGYGNEDKEAKRVNTDDPITPNEYRPYVPSLSLFLYNDKLTLIDDNHLAGWAAGTDCVAFTQKSAGYPGSPYTWFSNNDKRLGACFWGSSRGAAIYPHECGACWTITEEENEDLNKVIPGDILYYTNNTRHLALVSAVVYNERSRTTNISQVYLIESVYGNDYNNIKNTFFGQVVKYRSINNYNNRNWVIARLKINN